MIEEFIKAALAELKAFAKKTHPRFAVLADLLSASEVCNTKEGRAMIDSLITPLQKELLKEAEACKARIGSAWKKAKGEKITPELQKKLDAFQKEGLKTTQASGILKPKVKKSAGAPGTFSMNFGRVEYCYLDCK